jgi:anti-sigma B factor antagonist
MQMNTMPVKEEFSVDIIDGISVIKFNTLRATLNEAKALKYTMDSLVTGNHYKMIIDFSNTLFLDSSIASVLINIVREVRKIKGDILTVTPKNNIKTFFDKTGLNRIFRQFNSTEQALAGFSSL